MLVLSILFLGLVIPLAIKALHGEWERIYGWKQWYLGHPTYVFSGTLRRNERTDVFVREDGHWEYLEGRPPRGRGYVSPARVPSCDYILDRTIHGQSDIYIHSPREVTTKNLLGIEEVEHYDETSRPIRILEKYNGKNVSIRGWTREEIVHTPTLSIHVQTIIPGKIKPIN